MTERDDHALLREYAETGSEPAFAALVERHLNLVHSAALRRTGNPHAAGEIAQAVFIILARKAEKLNHKTILSGWLYQTAQLTAANYLRGEIRRQRREQEAYVQSILNEPSDDWAWRQIAPELEEAMAKLGDRDRNAIVLRYFENKSLAEVGAALGASEDAAKMRVNRALEKLRKIFNGRGVVLTTMIIAGAVSANSVQSAPIGMAEAVSAVAVAKGAAAGTSTLTLVKGALKVMAWAKTKTVIVVGGVALLLAGTTIVTVTKGQKQERHYESWQVFDPTQAAIILAQTPPQVKIVPTAFPQGGSRYTAQDGRRVLSWDHYADQGAMGLNCSISDILRYACSEGPEPVAMPRTMTSTELPDQCYDFITNLKTDPKWRLRQAIKSKLGVVGKFERRPVNVLVLTAGSDLSSVNGPQKLRGIVHAGTGVSMLKTTSTTNLAKQVELFMNYPVVDDTKISNTFDLTLRWSPADTTSSNALQKVLSDELGLHLVPTNMPIKMLVVERMKK